MKVLLKLFKKFINIIILPFDIIWKILENSKNNLTLLLKLFIFLIITILLSFIYSAKPYRMFLSGFYFEKYSTAEEAKKDLLKFFPIKNVNYIDYIYRLENKDLVCKNINKNEWICIYYENLIYKKIRWDIILKTNSKNIINIDIKRNIVISDMKIFENFVKKYV